MLAVLAGCGGKKDASAELFDSRYCVSARMWAVHELDGGADGAYAGGGAAALKKWWSEQLRYLKSSLEQAPAEIREAEAVNERAVRTRFTPLLEKYGFDFKRFEAQATRGEKAFVEQPPPEIVAADEARTRYQDRVCGTGGSPPPAKVTFRPSAASKAYCAAAEVQEKGLEPVVSSRFDPEVFRAYVTSDSFSRALDAQVAAAPPEIAADVKADNAWVRDHKLEVLKDYDYDLRRLLLEGSAADLAEFTYFDPAIAKQDSRVEAYVSQVCGR